MGNVSDKSRIENQNIFYVQQLFSENRGIYEIMSKIVVEPERPQMTIWRRVACWIIEATRAQAHGCARAPPPPTRARSRTHTRTHTNM